MENDLSSFQGVIKGHSRSIYYTIQVPPEVGVALEVLVEERPVVAVLKEPGPDAHRGLNDLVTDGEEDVAGHGSSVPVGNLEIGRPLGLVPLDQLCMVVVSVSSRAMHDLQNFRAQHEEWKA